MSFGLMWRTLILAGSLLAVIIYLMLPKEHCVCGFKIPEGGGMCECGEYNSRMITRDGVKLERREQELKRIEEERRKGNDYDTFL